MFYLVILSFIFGSPVYSRSSDCNNAAKLRPNDQLICCFFKADNPNPTCVQEAINKGADPKQSKDKNGTTPLMYSATLKDTQVWNLVVDSSEINAKDKDGKTALHYAALGERPDKIKILLEYKKAKYTADLKGYTPLAYLLHDTNDESSGSSSVLLSNNFIEAADALFKYDTDYQNLLSQLKGKTVVYNVGKTKFDIPQDTQIVLFAERHYIEEKTQEIIKDVVNSCNFDYYATEFIPAVQQKRVDLINAGFLPIEVVVTKDIKLAENKNQIAFTQTKLPLMGLYYSDLYKFINSKNIKIVALDIRTKDNADENSDPDSGWAQSDTGITTRNVQWVKILKSMIAAEPKTKILVHGGDAHIAYNSTPEPVSNIMRSSVKVLVVDASVQSTVANYMLHKMGLDDKEAIIYGFPKKFSADIFVRPLLIKEKEYLPKNITKNPSMLQTPPDTDATE